MPATIQGIEFEIKGSVDSSANSTQRLVDTLGKLQTAMTRTSSGTAKMATNLRSASSSAKNLSKAMSKIRSAIGAGFGGLMSATGPVAGLRAMGSVAKSLSNTLGGLVGRFKRLLIMRTFRAMIRAITQAFKDGISNLYQWSNAMGGEFAKSMDMASTSAQYLKNSLAAMVAPIINNFAPALDYAIDKVVDFINTINMLFAKLTGATYWTRARKIVTSYGNAASDAIGGAGSAAKEALKYLAPFDELNVLPSDSGSGGGGGGGSAGGDNGASDMFETVPLDNALSGLDEFLQKIRDIGNVFKSAWEDKGQAVLTSFHNALNSIGTAIGAIGDSFYRVFTGGYGYDWLTSAFQLCSDLLDTVTLIGDAFTNAWNKNGAGDSFVASIFESMTAIQNLADTVVTTFNQAFASGGRGETTFSHLLSIATSLNNTITNIATNFEAAWSNNGTAIWENILDTVNSVLDAIDDCAQATEDWSKDVDFNSLLTSIEDITSSFSDLADEISGDLSWAYQNVVLPLAKQIIESGLPNTISAISDAIVAVKSAIEAAKPVLSWVYEKIVEPVGRLINTQTVNNIQGFADAMKSVASVFNGEFMNNDNTFDITGLYDALLKVEDWALRAMNLGWVVNTAKGLKAIATSIADITGTREDWADFWPFFLDQVANVVNPIIGALNSVFGELTNFLNTNFGLDLPTIEIPLIGKVEDVEDNVPITKKIIPGLKGKMNNVEDAVPSAKKTTTGWTAQHEYQSRAWKDKSAKKWTTVGWTAQHQYTSRNWIDKATSAWTTHGWTAEQWYLSRDWKPGQNWTTYQWTAQQQYIDRNWDKRIDWTTYEWTAQMDYLRNNIPSSQRVVSVTAVANGISYGGGIYGYTRSNGGVFSGGKWHDIARYASGGLPSGSQLFWAREKGPELVGTLGGHTAVMNNDQIVASVSAGVARAVSNVRFRMAGIGGSGSDEDLLYRAMLRALNDSNVGGDMTLDGNVLYKAMVNRNNQNTRLTGVNALATG